MAMADLKAQFENTDHLASAPQMDAFPLGNGAGPIGNSANNSISNEGLDRSSHFISSESSVASANTSTTRSTNASSLTSLTNKQPSPSSFQKQEQDASSSSEEKKEDEHYGNANSASTMGIHAVHSAAVSSGTGNAASSTDNRSPLVLQISAPPHPVAEFLFQLTKMLTDNNSEFIEWSNASIYVHDPPGLEKNILPKYFRHSNYSSFVSLLLC